MIDLSRVLQVIFDLLIKILIEALQEVPPLARWGRFLSLIVGWMQQLWSTLLGLADHPLDVKPPQF